MSLTLNQQVSRRDGLYTALFLRQSSFFLCCWRWRSFWISIWVPMWFRIWLVDFFEKIIIIPVVLYCCCFLSHDFLFFLEHIFSFHYTHDIIVGFIFVSGCLVVLLHSPISSNIQFGVNIIVPLTWILLLNCITLHIYLTYTDFLPRNLLFSLTYIYTFAYMFC